MAIHVSGYNVATTDGYEKLGATILEIGNVQTIRTLRKVEESQQ